jgi:hypothetical protein
MEVKPVKKIKFNDCKGYLWLDDNSVLKYEKAWIEFVGTKKELVKYKKLKLGAKRMLKQILKYEQQESK